MKAISICVSQPENAKCEWACNKIFGQQMEVKRRFYSGELHQEAQRSIDLKRYPQPPVIQFFLHCMLVNLYN